MSKLHSRCTTLNKKSGKETRFHTFIVVESLGQIVERLLSMMEILVEWSLVPFDQVSFEEITLDSKLPKLVHSKDQSKI